MKTIVLASANPGKIQEFKQALNTLPFELIPLSAFQNFQVVETGNTFIENALIKARHATQLSGLPAIADDSGLVIPALKGEPGVYSARYAGENASNEERIKKVLTELTKKNHPDLSAYFYCITVFMKNAEDQTPLICEGKWLGEILLTPRGAKGFGYDPIFYVPTHQCSAAELTTDEKNAISHRGQALKKLITALIDTTL